MTPNERAMIEELFARIGSTAMPQRDAEADRLIGDLMTRTPGAAYALAQTVLVQDQALREAAERLRQAEAQARPPEEAPPPSQGGLLDRFGLGTQRPGGVPRTGPAAEPAQAQPGAGGGFLTGALQTAAGVAGGALLFEGIKGLFGSEAHASTPEPSPAAASPWGEANADGKDNGFQTGAMDDKSNDDDDHAAHDDDDDDGGWGDDGGFDGGDGGGDV